MMPAFSDDAFMMKLEMERLNTDYRTKFGAKSDAIVVAKEVVRKCQRIHITAKERQARDQMMFNAGRAAAGATDQVALKAHEKLMKELENE